MKADFLDKLGDSILRIIDRICNPKKLDEYSVTVFNEERLLDSFYFYGLDDLASSILDRYAYQLNTSDISMLSMNRRLYLTVTSNGEELKLSVYKTKERR